MNESRALMEAAKRIAVLTEENARLKSENVELAKALEAHEVGLEKIKDLQEEIKK